MHNFANVSGGALYLEQTSLALVTAGSISENSATYGGGILVADNSCIAITDSTQLQGNIADTGGAVSARDSAKVIMKNSTVSDNQARSSGGGLSLENNAHGSLTGCTVLSNAAEQYGGGLIGSGDALLLLHDSLVADNRVGRSGGGIETEEAAQLVLLGGTNVTSNRANGRGGGADLQSSNFDKGQVDRAVQHNSALDDADVAVFLTSLAIVGNRTIAGYANRVGTDKGLLHVAVKASGYYGLPCQGLLLEATLADGTFLDLNRSDQHGLTYMSLKIPRPPGVHVVSIASIDVPDVPAASLTLHLRCCIRGEVNPSPYVCQPCQQGFFSFDPGQGVCDTCPSNANCSGGDVTMPLPGYWRSSADSIQIHRWLGKHRCPNPSACIAADEAALLACAAYPTCGTSTTYKDLQCSSGYHGNLCGLCSAGNAATRLLVCRECLKTGYIIALYTVAALLILGLIKLLCVLTRNQDNATDGDVNETCKVPAAQLLRPLVLYSQYMLIVSSMPIEWPVSIAYPLKVLAWLWSPASPETLSIDCLLQRSARIPMSIQKVLFYVCMPLVVLVLLLLVEMAQVCITRAHKNHAAVQMKELLYSSTLVALFFFVPSVLRTLFSMFACVPLDQPAPPPYAPAAVGSFWVLDMNQQCFIGYHRAWSLAFGLPCVFVVCLGWPVGVLFLMYTQRAHLADQIVRQHYGFLFMSYRQRLCYWECVVMVETMVLVAISVFGVNLGVFYQANVMLVALMLMVVLLLIFRPYAYPRAGRVMLQAVSCLLLTSYTSLTLLQFGSIQPSPLYGIIMGCVMVLINLVFVVSVL